MAIEYILFTDADVSPAQIRLHLINSVGFSEAEGFRHFLCMSGPGVQAQTQWITESHAPNRVFTDGLDGIPWTLKPKTDIFFTLSKDEYGIGKVNMVRAVVAILAQFPGNALLYNNESPNRPVLLRYQGRLVLTAHPESGFWDTQYVPEVLSLVTLPFDFATPEIAA